MQQLKDFELLSTTELNTFAAKYKIKQLPLIFTAVDAMEFINNSKKIPKIIEYQLTASNPGHVFLSIVKTLPFYETTANWLDTFNAMELRFKCDISYHTKFESNRVRDESYNNEIKEIMNGSRFLKKYIKDYLHFLHYVSDISAGNNDTFLRSKSYFEWNTILRHFYRDDDDIQLHVNKLIQIKNLNNKRIETIKLKLQIAEQKSDELQLKIDGKNKKRKIAVN